jgi:hypothetical protein
MPGLLRGVARTAVIAGTATHVSNNVSRRQANRWAQQDQDQYAQDQYYAQQQQQAAAAAAPVAAAAAAPQKDTVTQLKELADLKSQGILTDEEFQAQKAKILG